MTAPDTSAPSPPPVATSGPAPTPSSDASTVERLGPYAVLGRLARGGMGDVLVGRDAQGVEVALKVLRAPPGDEVAHKRFEREGAVLESLQHPGIVRVLARGFDEASRRPWLALELVRGRDVEAILRTRVTRKLTADETALIVSRVADALAAAHAAGVVHRDVKPANVLCTPDRRVLVGDLGIALTEDVSVRLTRDEILGTPAYLAPEVLLGGPWEACADVYALGALAWRCLVGRPLFEADTATEVLAERLTSETPRLADVAPGTSPELCRLVDAMLERDPAKRPAPGDVVRALEARAREGDTDALWRDAAPRADTSRTARLPVRRVRVLAPGDTFLHYQVEAELGRGGMGVVYRAWHQGLGKRVALKVLLAGALATETERRRFLGEAQAASALQHPCVVPVLDAGEHDGTFYLVLELIDGQPLSRWLGERPRGRAELLALFLRLCDGVQHAHTRGVIHRDLKPDNVLITDDSDVPAPHILDFGLAKRIGEDEDQPAERGRGLVGTLRYMAPEQAAGKVNEVDVRSDVYALGTILYELLTGSTPFRGNAREVHTQILLHEPDPPRRRAADLPWELDAICLKALRKDRDARYQSALDLKADLERYLQDRPILAAPSTPRYRLTRWARRNRERVALGGGAALLAVVLLAGWVGSLASRRAAHERRVGELAADGWRSLAAGDAQVAVERFALARELIGADDVLLLSGDAAVLLSDDARASLTAEELERPRVTSARLAEWTAHARRRLAHAEVDRLVREARAHHAAGHLEDAARAVELARRLDPDAPDVRSLRDELLRVYAQEAERASVAAAEDPDLTRRRVHLERWRALAEAARRVDPESPVAQELLAHAHAELGKQAELEQGQAVRERQRAQAAALMDAADRALVEGDVDAARRSFEQALAFDGGNDRAQDGLVHVTRQAETRDREREERARAARVVELRARAAESLADARARFADGELPNEVRDRYLAAIESLRQALFLAPGDAEAAADLQGVAREFAVVLVDQGNPELAGFILRVGGVDPSAPVQAELPRDPHLAVIESDRVNVRQAFGGVVNFLPTRAFDALREHVRSQTDRYRFSIEIRSEIVTGGVHPQVFVTGLRVRMEDRVVGTVSPPVDVPFEGGPYVRQVVVSAQAGRLVRPFDVAVGLDAGVYVRQVTGLVQGMLQRGKR